MKKDGSSDGGEPKGIPRFPRMTFLIRANVRNGCMQGQQRAEGRQGAYS